MKKDQNQKIKELATKVKGLLSKTAVLEEDWKRSQADFENYKKRNEEQRIEILNLQKADFMTKIAPVLDNFRRAFDHVPKNNFAKGVKHIEKQLEDILISEGLQKIPAKTGEKFDCNLHEAISCEINKTIPADCIIGEIESGWMFDGRVIKPAKVRVSKGK